jgi:hypothetical protein
MDNSEHDKFDSPRYKLTWVGNGYRSYLDLQTGIGYCLPYNEKRNSVNSLLDKEYISRNNNEMFFDNKHGDSSGGYNSILDMHDDIIQLIVGVSVRKGGIRHIVGAHAFIMYIVDPYNTARDWMKDIMLDASGDYGVRNHIHRKKNVDIVEPTSPTTITIDSYRRYFYGYKEILHTYSYIIDKSVGQNIKTLITNAGKQRPMACADKASYILEQSGLFPGIKNDPRPIVIKRFCDKFVPANNKIMAILEKASYDLESLPEENHL